MASCGLLANNIWSSSQKPNILISSWSCTNDQHVSNPPPPRAFIKVQRAIRVSTHSHWGTEIYPMTKAPPCISSIEFEGDKSNIRLFQVQVKHDIFLKLFVIVTWLLWANHSPGFSHQNTIMAGKWILVGKSWAMIGSKQSHDNNKQNGAKKKNKMSEICNFQAVIG